MPCPDCDIVYICQMKQNLLSQLKEHKAAILNIEPKKSSLCKHVFESDHHINWNSATILKQEQNWSKWLVAEKWSAMTTSTFVPLSVKSYVYIANPSTWYQSSFVPGFCCCLIVLPPSHLLHFHSFSRIITFFVCAKIAFTFWWCASYHMHEMLEK